MSCNTFRPPAAAAAAATAPPARPAPRSRSRFLPVPPRRPR
ncbi:Uncharacterised protein [Bordetella parapertussis]|nr:Uncharacterised protein [Bordetella parapertussis]SUV58563.1 Uncharacterised protein [Bordetella parapertussis]SUV79062.1 Uncharacterised protein [Bordetella parapertussis]VEF52677.1 Uncharacterised protein [Bordetella parapertussis]VTR30841.1 Uncharacterised protein [Bordetella parapertussis]